MDTIEQRRQKLFEQMKQYISDIIGEDIVEELDVTPDSAFTSDLEMDSIEIVAFAEKINSQFGDEIDFTAWLTELEMDELISLSIKDVINFIENAQNTDK